MVLVKTIQNGNEYACIGTIVSQHKVMAPARCVYRRSSVKLEFGILNSSKPDFTVNVSLKDITIHPGYSSYMDNYNIAVIELPNKIEFGPNVTNIEMVDESHVLETWTEVSILGYAKGDQSQAKLHAIVSDITSFKTCHDGYDTVNRMVMLREGLEFCVNMHDAFSTNAHYYGG